MVDPATLTAAIAAATGAVGLFDKIADQVERFITRKPKPEIPKEHRMKIERSGDDIVARKYGREWQRITAEDLRRLPESQLRHIRVLETSMKNHYRVWERTYPELALLDSPIQKARVESQLQDVIRAMGGDLEGILTFLESCGMVLDDHYMEIRDLVKRV
jgi:hypothetical protein